MTDEICRWSRFPEPCALTAIHLEMPPGNRVDKFQIKLEKQMLNRKKYLVALIDQTDEFSIRIDFLNFDFSLGTRSGNKVGQRVRRGFLEHGSLAFQSSCRCAAGRSTRSGALGGGASHSWCQVQSVLRTKQISSRVQL